MRPIGEGPKLPYPFSPVPLRDAIGDMIDGSRVSNSFTSFNLTNICTVLEIKIQCDQLSSFSRKKLQIALSKALAYGTF